MDHGEAIEGWPLETIEQSFQECTHLKNFVSFIDRAKYQSLKLKNKQLQINSEPSPRLNKQSKHNFLNANLFKANTKSILHMQNPKLQTQPSPNKSTLPNTQQQNLHKSQLKLSYFNSDVALGHRVRANLKHLDQRQECGFLPKKKKKSYSVKDIGKQDRMTRSKMKRQIETKRDKEAVDWKSYQTINQEKIKKLKSLFFKTVENKSHDEQKIQKKYQIRLKNALDSSNKKRKQLQNLFRRRDNFEETNLSKILNFQSIYHITSTPSNSFFETTSLQQPKPNIKLLDSPRRKQKIQKLTRRTFTKREQ